MKVVDGRIKDNTIDFMNVKYGIPFEYKGDLFIKTNNGLIKEDTFTNAVSLKSGILCKFGDLERVELVNAEVVVK